MQVEWTDFKTFIDARGLSIQYILVGKTYWMKAFDGPFSLETTVHKKDTADDPSDQKDFEDNYLPTANKTFTDGDGSMLSRSKMATAGWTYHARFIEFTTSLLSSVKNENEFGTDWADATIKFYDNVNTELTVQETIATDCVKTVFSFEPAYDMEIIGGAVITGSTPANDLHMWCISVPDIPVSSGGSKNMINQLNLKLLPNASIDGRTPKRMNYNETYHTNKLCLTFKHTAGEQNKLMFKVEHFKA